MIDKSYRLVIIALILLIVLMGMMAVSSSSEKYCQKNQKGRLFNLNTFKFETCQDYFKQKELIKKLNSQRIENLINLNFTVV